MRIKDIETIITVNNFESISRAADYIGVSQPSLSKLINEIEKYLKIKIFTRLSRGVKLTKEGEIFLHHSKLALTNFNQGIEEVNKLKSEYTEKLTLTIHPLLGKFIIPKIENALKDYKTLELDYLFQNSRIGIGQVLNSKVDFAIAADVFDYPDIVKIKLWKEYIGLYSLDGTYKENILYNSNMISANRFLKSLNFNSKKEINDYSILYSILKRSPNTMALLPNPVAENENKVKLIKRFNPSIDISLVYRSDRTKTKGLTTVISILKNLAKITNKNL